MIGPPAPRPCSSCPYRQDVPSGVWTEHEYAKLPDYDHDTSSQPMLVFQCHQNGLEDDRARMCAGWAGVHKDPPLMALRIGLVTGQLDEDTFVAAMDYESPVPLFESGLEAYEHGIEDIDDPSPQACALVMEIARKRGLEL